MDQRPASPLDDEGLPRLSVFGVAACEDTAITRDRLRALNVPYVYADLDADHAADAYVRGLLGHRVTPLVVVGVEQLVEAEPDIETVDLLAAAAWPGLPIDRPVLGRLHGDSTNRAVPYATLPVVTAPGTPAAGPRSLATERNRRQVALLFTHGAPCLACLGYAKRLVAAKEALSETSSMAVVVGRGDPDSMAAWRHDLPPEAVLLADPDDAWRRLLLGRLIPAPGAPGSTIRFLDEGVALLLLDRYGAPRAMLAGSDAGDLVTPGDIAEWMAYLEVECGGGSCGPSAWGEDG